MRDIDIRSSLLQSLDLEYGSDPDTMVVEEFGLCRGSARVDVVVINGSIHGFEIKSERDTLRRLPKQQEIYNKTLDFVTLVTSRSHIKSAREIIPKWWGIAEARHSTEGIIIKEVRKPKLNKSVDPYSLAQLLWRPEVLSVLREHNLHRGLSKKSVDYLWGQLARQLTKFDLGAEIRSRIKARQYWRSD